MSNDDYHIKITKPSKYPRTNGWCEDEGVLTPEERDYIINMDRIDTRLEEGIELTDEDRQYLLSLEAKKVDRSKLKIAKISRKETIFFTKEEEHYLDTHDNSISGEITNFTLEDLEMFDKKDGDV